MEDMIFISSDIYLTKKGKYLLWRNIASNSSKINLDKHIYAGQDHNQT